jgi:hypothetical protein
MRTTSIVLVAALALALPLTLPTAAASSCNASTGHSCTFTCQLGDFIHVSGARTGFGSIGVSAECGGASADCTATNFDATCSGSSLTPATRTAVGTCTTYTTSSTATCWTSPYP